MWFCPPDIRFVATKDRFVATKDSVAPGEMLELAWQAADFVLVPQRDVGLGTLDLEIVSTGAAPFPG